MAQTVNRLGFKVVIVTAGLLLLVLVLYWMGRALLLRDPNSTQLRPQTLTERQEDADDDGIADLYETAYYNTDPTKKDTDDDGTSDLDEILSGRNPTAVGPRDEIKPATGDLVTDPKTFTQKYMASLPSDIPRENILDQVKLSAFVDDNKGELLPVVAQEAITVVPGEGAPVVEAYLESVSSKHNPAIKAVTSTDLEAAFRLLVTAQNTEQIGIVVQSIEETLTALKEVATPAETRELHVRMISASEALLASAQMLQDVDNDFVGSLIAAKKIEELGPVYDGIAQDVLALEEKYGLQ